MIPKIETSVPGFDALLHGGIPRGRSTLIVGRSGTCKSLLSLQIGAQLARGGEPTLILATEETPEDIKTTGDTLSFGVSDLVASKKMILMDLTRPAEGEVIHSGEYDVAGLIHRLRDAVRQHGIKAVVLDSATALFSPRPKPESLRSQFFALVSAMREAGLTSIITAESTSDYGNVTALGVEDFVCDLVIVLRNLVDGERRRRTLEVHKYRRSAHYKGEYPCTVTERGLMIFPLAFHEHEAMSPQSRYSSGVEGLDEMTGGGWLRDAIILLRGPSGSGKTTLAGMYARAGAARGERVSYYGFEETRPMLLRNFRQVGLPMDELIQAGHLRMECRYPEATSPEDMLLDIRTSLDQTKPSLVVLDSVSSIEHSTSAAGFRRFMIGLAALLREHARSALLTQTVSLGHEDDDAPYLSTIPDAIVLLDYGRDEPELRRTIRVLKMRGSAHSGAARSLVIAEGGLEVPSRRAEAKARP